LLRAILPTRRRMDWLRMRIGLRPTRRVATVPLGTRYGRWHVPLQLLTPESVVYSVGVGEDVSFDLALIERVGCHVWAFDPTPRAIAFAARLDEPRFHFHPWALWSTDTTLPFFVPANLDWVSHSLVNLHGTEDHIEVPCRSIHSIMRELGHQRVDLLKLDIEGAEYEVLGSLGEVHPDILCVELDQTMSISKIVAFMRSLPYDPIRVDRWNVTFVAGDR
jgi:FkbM family methyltransferase